MGTSDQRCPRARAGRRAAARLTTIAAIAALALLAACGQRGPLYLPDAQPGKKLVAHPEAPAPVAAPRH